MKILETERLVLSHLTVDDAPFILELLNDPSFLRFIGDRGVRTLADAHKYILDGPITSYEQHGFGLNVVTLKESNQSIGLCGLLKRETLADVDIGFAFLPQFTGMGYGLEAATAVLYQAHTVWGLKRVAAITAPDNTRSIRLLEKLGLQFERMVSLSEGSLEICLLAKNFG